MHRLLPAPLLGVVSALFAIATLSFWILPVMAGGLLKLIVPVPRWRLAVAEFTAWAAESAIAWLCWGIDRFSPADWQVEGDLEFRRDRCYLVTSNHSSWVDIAVLFYLFNRRAPFLRFFLKRQLLWVPIIGAACWALDFPFMRRPSRQELSRRPELAGRDLEIARRACERYRDLPVAILIFLEGTRSTAEKRRHRRSPYRHLLRPKSGGVGTVLAAMGERFEEWVDVTIAYPDAERDGPPKFWDLLCGRLNRVSVVVERGQVSPSLLGGDYRRDREFRARLQSSLSDRWRRKDDRIEALLNPAPSIKTQATSRAAV